jgi:hypothetical protein
VLDEPSVTPLSAAAATQMSDLFESLVTEFRNHLPGGESRLSPWLSAILVGALRRKLELAPDPVHTRSPDSQLATRYRALIESELPHAAEHRGLRPHVMP